MKRTRTVFVFVVVGASCLMRGGPLYAQSEGVDEEKAIKVKAAYLLNFTKFVTWPANAFHDENSPIIIGIVGNDPFGKVLDQTIKDKTVSGRGLKIERFPVRTADGLTAMKRCHLLYVSSSLGADAVELIQALASLPILIIGEGVEFAKYGGAVGFVVEDGRIAFWVSKKTADTAKLQLSSQLLKLARPTE